MKTIGILAGLILIASMALAEPIYYCDCQTNTDYFEIEIDSVVAPCGDSTQGCAPGEIRPSYDLASLANGDHDIRVRGCNTWGCTDWSDFLSFTKGLPAVPAGCQY